MISSLPDKHPLQVTVLPQERAHRRAEHGRHPRRHLPPQAAGRGRARPRAPPAPRRRAGRAARVDRARRVHAPQTGQVRGQFSE